MASCSWKASRVPQIECINFIFKIIFKNKLHIRPIHIGPRLARARWPRRHHWRAHPALLRVRRGARLVVPRRLRRVDVTRRLQIRL